MNDEELREAIEKVVLLTHDAQADYWVSDSMKDIMQLITARDAAKELDIEEHINSLNIGHINSGMGIEDLRRVFERRRAEIELRRESDQAKEEGNG